MNKNKAVNNIQPKLNNYGDIEKCVICGGDTPYTINTPINDREFYIDGLGQVCQKCHYEICVKKDQL